MGRKGERGGCKKGKGKREGRWVVGMGRGEGNFGGGLNMGKGEGRGEGGLLVWGIVEWR